jgi:hypothetical protein
MATEHFLNWVEGKAHGLRSKCDLQPFARLDPFELANAMGVKTLEPRLVGGLTPDVLHRLLVGDSSSWSAGTLHGPDGRMYVVMNPTHDIRRQRSSLMEELAHVELGHQPSKLIHLNGVCIRSWKQAHETEAYWVGAAALVPRRVMKGARTLGLTVEEVAEKHGVSEDLVLFREKVLGIRLERLLPA